MPRDIEFDSGEVYPVATEEELLEFVNKARAAGGADILEALLPSKPEIASQCLIANGLNFGCTVSPINRPADLENDDEYRFVWGMTLPPNISEDQIDSIAEALGLGRASRPSGRTLGPLPAHIGNAADAFDERLAFTDFIVPEED